MRGKRQRKIWYSRCEKKETRVSLCVYMCYVRDEMPEGKEKEVVLTQILMRLSSPPESSSFPSSTSSFLLSILSPHLISWCKGGPRRTRGEQRLKGMKEETGSGLRIEWKSESRKRMGSGKKAGPDDLRQRDEREKKLKSPGRVIGCHKNKTKYLYLTDKFDWRSRVRKVRTGHKDRGWNCRTKKSKWIKNVTGSRIICYTPHEHEFPRYVLSMCVCVLKTDSKKTDRQDMTAFGCNNNNDEEV